MTCMSPRIQPHGCAEPKSNGEKIHGRAAAKNKRHHSGEAHKYHSNGNSGLTRFLLGRCSSSSGESHGGGQAQPVHVVSLVTGPGNEIGTVYILLRE